jgi:hypothetical protein
MPNIPGVPNQEKKTFRTYIRICRPAIKQPLTGRNKRESERERGRERERDVYVSDCRVWTETAKGKEQICKEKSVKEVQAQVCVVKVDKAKLSLSVP